MLRIEADVLIPGTDDVVKNGCVLIDSSKIVYVGPVENAPRSKDGEKTVSVPVVMPGMWDSHTHLAGLKTADLTEGEAEKLFKSLRELWSRWKYTEAHGASSDEVVGRMRQRRARTLSGQ